MKLEGIITKGKGRAHNYIPLQKRIFEQKGLKGAGNFKDGTLNINITPLKYEIIRFDYFFSQVKWSENKRAEDFGFIEIEEIVYNNQTWEKSGYVYIPHNSPHFGNKNQFEVIAIEIPLVMNEKEIGLIIKEGRIRCY